MHEKGKLNRSVKLGEILIFIQVVVCIRKTVLHVCGLEHAFGRTSNSAHIIMHVCKTYISLEFIHIHII